MASFISIPESIEAKKPPLKLSPAPVVSTTFLIVILSKIISLESFRAKIFSPEFLTTIMFAPRLSYLLIVATKLKSVDLFLVQFY